MKTTGNQLRIQPVEKACLYEIGGALRQVMSYSAAKGRSRGSDNSVPRRSDRSRYRIVVTDVRVLPRKQGVRYRRDPLLSAWPSTICSWSRWRVPTGSLHAHGTHSGPESGRQIGGI